MRHWRCNAATTNRDQGSQSIRHGVREFRPTCRVVSKSQTHEAEEIGGKAQEKSKVQGLAFSLPAPLAFRSLPLLALPGQPIPCQATASDLGTHVREALRIRELTCIVAERLFIQITKQVKRLYADVRAPSCSCERCRARTLPRDPQRRADIRQQARHKTSAHR